MANYKAKKIMHNGDEIKLGGDSTSICYEWECLGSLYGSGYEVSFSGSEYKEFTTILPYCSYGSTGRNGYFVSDAIPDNGACWMYLCDGCICVKKQGDNITVKVPGNYSSNENNAVWGKKAVVTRTDAGFIDIMLIGGGGGAGGNGNCAYGGGGGGAVKQIISQPIYATDISLSVGKGGTVGNRGCNSKILTYTAGGGGGGGADGYTCCCVRCGHCGSGGGGGFGINSNFCSCACRAGWRGGTGSNPGGNGANGCRNCGTSDGADGRGGGGGGATGSATLSSQTSNTWYMGSNGGAGCTTDFTGQTETFGGGGGGGILGCFCCASTSPSSVSITKGCGCDGGGNGGYWFCYIHGGTGGTGCLLTCYATMPTSCGSGGGGGYGGTSGANGLIVIRYKTDGSCGILPSSLGGTKVTRGEWTIHCFTSTNEAQHFYPVYK